MTLHSAFLHDIRAHPGDDGLRLIYADWLEEQGDPAGRARAEFIRLQCRLAGMTGSEPDYHDLRAREQVLLRDHEAAWLGPVRAALKQWAFRRGFLEEVALAVPSFVGRAGPLLEREPVGRVRFLKPSAHVGLLADSPLLGRVRGLDLSYGYLNDAAVQTLAASPYLGRLEELLLGHNFIRAAGAAALAAAPGLDRLLLLDLRGNQPGAAGRQALLDRFGAAVRFCLGRPPVRVPGEGAWRRVQAPSARACCKDGGSPQFFLMRAGIGTCFREKSLPTSATRQYNTGQSSRSVGYS